MINTVEVSSIRYELCIQTEYDFLMVYLHLYNENPNGAVIIVQSPDDVNILYYFKEIKKFINSLDESKAISDYTIYLDLTDYEYQLEGNIYQYVNGYSNDLIPCDDILCKNPTEIIRKYFLSKYTLMKSNGELNSLPAFVDGFIKKSNNNLLINC